METNLLREIKAQPEVAVNAVKKLLANSWQADISNVQHYKNSVRFYMSSGGFIEITADGSATAAGFWLSQSQFERLVKSMDRLGGLLAQERVRQAVKKVAAVESEQRAPNGTLVMNVKLGG
ncbi:MAG: hypothetical protein QXI12_10460 [Candidatus Methanomethyliaceae archaeon]